MRPGFAWLLLVLCSSALLKDQATCNPEGTCDPADPDDEFCLAMGQEYLGTDAQSLAEKAMNFHTQGKFVEASTLYRFLLCKYKAYKDLYLNYADATASSGDLSSAIMILNRAWERFPGDSDIAVKKHAYREQAETAKGPSRYERDPGGSSDNNNIGEVPGNVEDPWVDRGERWPDEYTWWKTLTPAMRPADEVTSPEFDGLSASEIVQEYESRHRAAFRALQDHGEGKRIDNEALRFVVVGPGSGFGNRQMVIVAAFLYAILSKRVLLVDWVSHKTQAFADVGDLYENPEGLILSFTKARRLWPTWSGWGNSSMIVFDNTHYYTAEWGVDELACRQFEVEHEMDAVVSILTDQYVASFIAVNPHYSNVVNLLGDGGNLYANLFSYLLRPVRRIRQIVRRFVKAEFEGYYVIGLQVRYGVGQFYLPEDENEFWACAKAMGRVLPLETQRKLKYFIASDSQEVISHAQRALGDSLVYFKTVRGNDKAGKEAWYGAAVDNFLLSECDDLVITSTSTFGYVASARRGRNPPMTMSGMFRRCVRHVSSQPQNTAHGAIRRASCFKDEVSLRPEEDMLCANLGSNHACNSPTALRMASRFQQRNLVREFNFNMHRNGDPAIPTDVVEKLDDLASLKIFPTIQDLRHYVAKGQKLLEQKDVAGARRELGYAAAIAYIHGGEDNRIEAYSNLAKAYLSIDIESPLDLSAAMHMFWRIIRERQNATHMIHQASFALPFFSPSPYHLSLSLLSSLLLSSLLLSLSLLSFSLSFSPLFFSLFSPPLSLSLLIPLSFLSSYFPSSPPSPPLRDKALFLYFSICVSSFIICLSLLMCMHIIHIYIYTYIYIHIYIYVDICMSYM
ncbi:hypothetical protein AAMO2058_000086500 [Amorphochlora amoebiformis]